MRFGRVNADGLNVFYRECGDVNKPVMVLFHGFPSASHMFRDLMPMLEKDFHLERSGSVQKGPSQFQDCAGKQWTFCAGKLLRGDR